MCDILCMSANKYLYYSCIVTNVITMYVCNSKEAEMSHYVQQLYSGEKERREEEGGRKGRKKEKEGKENVD